MTGKRARLVKHIYAIWPTLTTLKEKCEMMRRHNLHNFANERLPWHQTTLNTQKTKRAPLAAEQGGAE